MPVTLETPYTPPVVDVPPAFDKVHLDQLTVELERTTYANTRITAKFVLYYVDASGNKVFDSAHPHYVNIRDAEAWAIEMAQAGDLRGVTAGEYLKQIVALLVSAKTGLGAAGVA